MAALSTRVEEKTDITIDLENHEVYYSNAEADRRIITEDIISNFIKAQENTNMNNTLRELTVTLIDNNPNLEDNQRIVFKKKEFITSASNEDVKLELIATGEVMPALNKHNKEVRATTIREDILESTGREVMLKPIKKLSDSQLEWRFVPTA
tara:strand:- start:1134 stop:1589 length:456 start_codon:yes stop_codon:yes gene_type:complete